VYDIIGEPPSFGATQLIKTSSVSLYHIVTGCAGLYGICDEVMKTVFEKAL
jgi:hypothetical protein